MATNFVSFFNKQQEEERKRQQQRMGAPYSVGASASLPTFNVPQVSSGARRSSFTPTVNRTKNNPAVVPSFSRSDSERLNKLKQVQGGRGLITDYMTPTVNNMPEIESLQDQKNEALNFYRDDIARLENLKTQDFGFKNNNRLAIDYYENKLGGLVPTAGERIDNALGSIVNKTAAAVPYAIETGVQAVKNIPGQINAGGNVDELRKQRDLLASATKNTLAGEVARQRLGIGASDVITKEQQQGMVEEVSKLQDEIDILTGAKQTPDTGIGARMMSTGQAMQDEALRGMSQQGQFATGLGMSGAQMALTLPLGATGAPIAMGVIAGSDSAYQGTAQGMTAGEAFSKGLSSGVIEAAAGKMPIDNILSLSRTGGTSFLKNVLKQAGLEATEEAAVYLANYMYDVASLNPNAEFSPQELALSAFGGALLGGAMGGIAGGVGSVRQNLNGEVDGYINSELDGIMREVENSTVNNPIDNVANSPINNVVNNPVDINNGIDNGINNFVEGSNSVNNNIINEANGSLNANLDLDVLAPTQAQNLAPILTRSEPTANVQPTGVLNQGAAASETQGTPNGVLQSSVAQNDVFQNKVSQSQIDNFTSRYSISQKNLTALINKGYDPKTIENMITNNGFVKKQLEKTTDKAERRRLQKQLNDFRVNVPELSGVVKRLNPPATTPQGREFRRITDGTGVINEYLAPGATVADANAAVLTLNQNNDPQGLKENTVNVLEGAYTKFVSSQASIEKIARAQKRLSGDSLLNEDTDLYRHSGGTLDTIVRTDMVDPVGNVIGQSYDSIFSQLPKEQWAAYHDFAANLHNINRAANGKQVNNNTPAESQRIVDEYLEKYPNLAEFDKLLKDSYQAFYKAWAVDSGLISQDMYEHWLDIYPHYMPTYRVQDMSTNYERKRMSKNIRNQLAKEAKGGDADLLPVWDQFIQRSDKIIKAQRMNEITKGLLDFARTNPQESANLGVVVSKDAAKELGITDEIENMFDSFAVQNIDGSYTVQVFENGKQFNIDVSKQIYDSLNYLRGGNINDTFLSKMADWSRAFLSLPRNAITQYNPVFALMTNPIRDAQTYALHATGNKKAENYFKAISEYQNKGEIYRLAKSMGLMNQRTYSVKGGYVASLSDKQSNVVKRNLDDLLMMTESIPRLAEFMNVLDVHGRTPEGIKKAALAANDVTVNFARSGNYSRFINSFTLFFNASVQGADKSIRVGIKNPMQVAGRVVAWNVIPQIILNVINGDNPWYEELSQYTRDSYYVIPNYLGEKDENGSPKTFFKLPKERVYGTFLTSLVDRTFQMVKDGEIDGQFDGVLAMLGANLSPVNPFTDNLVSTFSRTALFSEDDPGTTFFGGDIVPSYMMNLPKREQYDVKTSGAAKAVGNLFNLSPKKIDNLIDSYGGYFGDVLQKATAPENVGGDWKETTANAAYSAVVEPFTGKFTADPRFSSQPVTEFYDLRDEANKLSNSRNATEEQKAVAKELNRISGQMSDLYKQERAIMETKDSAANKNAQIKEIREQINALASSGVNGTRSEQFSPIDSKATATGGARSVISDASKIDISKYSESELSEFSDMGVTPQDHTYLKARVSAHGDNKVEYIESFDGFTPEQQRALIKDLVMTSDTTKAKMTSAMDLGIPEDTYIDAWTFGYKTTGSKAERNAQIYDYVNSLSGLSPEQKAALYDFVEAYQKKEGDSDGAGSSSSSGGSSSGSRSSSSSRKSGSSSSAADANLAAAKKLLSGLKSSGMNMNSLQRDIGGTGSAASSSRVSMRDAVEGARDYSNAEGYRTLVAMANKAKGR